MFGTFWEGTSSRACSPSTSTPRNWGSCRTTERRVSILPSIAELVEKVRAGGRVSAAEALELYRSAPTAVLGQLADAIRRRKHPEGVVTYIIDRNVNYTNVCVAKCNFCAFYREVGSPDGYVLGLDELYRTIEETLAVGRDHV